ncbi:MAG: Peptidase, family protein [Thermoleophilia bacterium]|nr:Peptidase, family protein [Thermoleophilia bacterium]
MNVTSLAEHIRIAPFVLPIVLLAFALHEMAHAYVATWFGDPTPGRHGRRTLNPIKHLDPVGTIMLVVSLLVFGFPFGFAVTPVDDSRMRKPRLHGALTAAAGPFVNLLFVATFMAVFIFAVQHTDEHSFQLGATDVPLLREIGYYGMSFNALLVVFNLLPIPPLDGGRIVGSMLSPEISREWNKIAEYGTFIVLGLVVFGGSTFSGFLEGMQGHLLDLVRHFVDANNVLAPR